MSNTIYETLVSLTFSAFSLARGLTNEGHPGAKIAVGHMSSLITHACMEFGIDMYIEAVKASKARLETSGLNDDAQEIYLDFCNYIMSAVDAPEFRAVVAKAKEFEKNMPH